MLEREQTTEKNFRFGFFFVFFLSNRMDDSVIYPYVEVFSRNCSLKRCVFINLPERIDIYFRTLR